MAKQGTSPERGRATVKDATDARVDRLISDCLRAFGQQLRAQRKARRVTQQEIEKRSGLSQSGLSKAENGTGDISMRTLLQIAIGLQVKPSFLTSLLDGCVSVAQTRITTVGDTAIAVDRSIDSDTIQSLSNEIEARATRAGKLRSKASRRRA